MHNFHESKSHKVINFLIVMFASKTIYEKVDIEEKTETGIFIKIKFYNYRINIQEDLKDNDHFFSIYKKGETITSGFSEVKYNIYYDIVNYLKKEGIIWTTLQ